jgi:hypothetical protein
MTVKGGLLEGMKRSGREKGEGDESEYNESTLYGCMKTH